MCGGAGDCSGRCGAAFKTFLLAGSMAGVSVTAAPLGPAVGGRGIGRGHHSVAAPSELHAEEHRRRVQNGDTAFDTSCDAGANCKTMAACDAAHGYPMTESMDIFTTICLNNVYWAEPAFSGLYDQGGYLTGETVGYYKCSCCGLPLYSSDHAYDARSGWPAYFDTIDGRALSDDSEAVLHNPANGELVCKRCGMHLGHRFTDGPRPTGLRDCIDSACLSFVQGSAYPQTAVPAEDQVSVYFGAGCYWHTQYDMYLAESDPSGPFARSGVTITSHVGYAGGWATGPDGLVCYHSDMAGTLCESAQLFHSRQRVPPPSPRVSVRQGAAERIALTYAGTKICAFVPLCCVVLCCAVLCCGSLALRLGLGPRRGRGSALGPGVASGSVQQPA
jgi:peptide-methionine (R)-S-oxide reductase